MACPLVSNRRAKAISSAVFLLGLAVISFQFEMWPAIMVVIGVSLALRQYLLGHIYDMILSLVVFFGVFFTSLYDISSDILLPVVFILGAIYLLSKEFWHRHEDDEAESEEDLNHEIEEEQDQK
jgi:predicted membrane protein